MTTEEFNNKYMDYLEKGHYGIAINNEEVIDYLDKEFQELIKIPDFQYTQIKLKFGYCRIYCDKVPVDKIYEMEEYINKLLR